MENNINISAIELYARKALKPFLDTFLTKEKIKGQEILGFCPIEQVNFFVVQQIFYKWKEETSRLKSPYFDYESTDVQEALKVFMDQLSQHILVSKEDFGPLLLQSINNTIHFVVSPVSFFEHKYLVSTKIYSKDELLGLFKYLKVNSEFKKCAMAKVDGWDGKTGATILAALMNEFGSSYVDKEAQESVLLKFSEVLPTSDADFRYQQMNAEAKETPEQIPPISIQDLVGKDHRPTALNMNLKNKLVDIRSAMSINQKIMFIKELFKGDNSAFEGAMSLAETAQSYEKCVNSLIDSYSQRFAWEIDSEEVNELFDLIGRKFYPDNFSGQE